MELVGSQARIQELRNEIQSLSQRYPEFNLLEITVASDEYENITVGDLIDVARDRMENTNEETSLQEMADFLNEALVVLREKVREFSFETDALPHVLEKGDIFINPEGKRIVVDGVRKEGKDTVIMFSYEETQNVRSEPGELLHQLPMVNFTVMRDAGDYTRFIYEHRFRRAEQEFHDIMTACQAVLEQVADQEIEGVQTERGLRNIKAFRLRMEKIHNMEDSWQAFGDSTTWETCQAKHELLKNLKKMIGKFPESLVEPSPLLSRIRQENLPKRKRDDTPGEGYNPKKKISKNRVPESGGEEAKKTRSSDQRLRRGGRRTVPTTPLDYGENGEYGQETEGEKESRELLWNWIDHIYKQQEALNRLAAEIAERKQVTEWKKALLALDTGGEHERLAQSGEMNKLTGKLADIRRTYLSWDPKVGGRDAQVADWIEELEKYSQQYEAIRQAGEQLKRSDARPKRGEQQRGKQREEVKRAGEESKLKKYVPPETNESDGEASEPPVSERSHEHDLKMIKQKLEEWRDTVYIPMMDKPFQEAGLSSEDRQMLLTLDIVDAIRTDILPNFLATAKVDLTPEEIESLVSQIQTGILIKE